MLWRAPARVFSGTSRRARCRSPRAAGDGAARSVELAQLAGGDPDQRDEVVGLPEAVDVGLAEADAAAQRAAPGGRVVDRDGGAQVGVGGAEARGGARLDDLDPPGGRRGSAPADGGAGERVPHGETNPFGRLPSGWGK